MCRAIKLVCYSGHACACKHCCESGARLTKSPPPQLAHAVFLRVQCSPSSFQPYGWGLGPRHLSKARALWWSLHKTRYMSCIGECLQKYHFHSIGVVKPTNQTNLATWPHWGKYLSRRLSYLIVVVHHPNPLPRYPGRNRLRRHGRRLPAARIRPTIISIITTTTNTHSTVAMCHVFGGSQKKTLKWLCRPGRCRGFRHHLLWLINGLFRRAIASRGRYIVLDGRKGWEAKQKKRLPSPVP